jgi:hypothetical protein
VTLSRGAIKDLSQLRYTLAHELGHAADLFLGGGQRMASDQEGTVQAGYGQRMNRLQLSRDNWLYGRGAFAAKAGYRYSRKEGFADLFAEQLSGRDKANYLTTQGEAFRQRGFNRKVIEDVARRTNSNYEEKDLGFLGNLARKDGLLGGIARFFGFAQGGSPEDTVPAMLTPGEYVLNRRAARRLGLANLQHMNQHGELPGFNTGGLVGQYAGGGPVEGFNETQRNAVWVRLIGALEKLTAQLSRTEYGKVTDVESHVSAATVKVLGRFDAARHNLTAEQVVAGVREKDINNVLVGMVRQEAEGLMKREVVVRNRERAYDFDAAGSPASRTTAEDVRAARGPVNLGGRPALDPMVRAVRVAVIEALQQQAGVTLKDAAKAAGISYPTYAADRKLSLPEPNPEAVAVLLAQARGRLSAGSATQTGSRSGTTAIAAQEAVAPPTAVPPTTGSPTRFQGVSLPLVPPPFTGLSLPLVAPPGGPLVPYNSTTALASQRPVVTVLGATANLPQPARPRGLLGYEPRPLAPGQQEVLSGLEAQRVRLGRLFDIQRLLTMREGEGLGLSGVGIGEVGHAAPLGSMSARLQEVRRARSARTQAQFDAVPALVEQLLSGAGPGGSGGPGGPRDLVHVPRPYWGPTDLVHVPQGSRDLVPVPRAIGPYLGRPTNVPGVNVLGMGTDFGSAGPNPSRALPAPPIIAGHEPYRGAIDDTRDFLGGVRDARRQRAEKLAAERAAGYNPPIPGPSRFFGWRGVDENTTTEQSGSLLGSLREKLGTRLGQIGVAGLFLGANAVSSLGTGLYGAIDKDRSESANIAAGRAEVVGGTAQGAAMAAGLGFGLTGGPWGAAIGGLIGGLIGLRSALNETAQKVQAARFERVTEEASKNFRILSSAAELDGDRLSKAAGDIDKLFAEGAEAGRLKAKASEGFFTSVSTEDYIKTVRAGETKALAPHLGNIGAIAGKRIESLVKESEKSGTGDTAADIFKQFAAANTPFLRALQTAGQSADELRKHFTQLALTAQKNIRLQEQMSAAGAALANTLFNFGAYGKAVEQAQSALKDLETRSRSLSMLFEGEHGALSSRAIDPSDLKFGMSDADPFREMLERVTSTFGPQGDFIRQQAISADVLTRNLPDILRESAGRGLQGESFNSRVTGRLQDLGVQKEHVNIVGTQLEQLSSRDPGNYIRKLSRGSNVEAQQLSGNIIRELQSALQPATRALAEEANRLVANLELAESNRRKLMGEQGKLDELRLSVTRNSARRLAEAVGQPDNAFRFVTLAQEQAPFTRSQERLTGLNGKAALDPDTIAARFRETFSSSQVALRVRESSNPATEEGRKAFEAFSSLNNQALLLKDALRALTDASKLNASIQERLNKLQEEREGRLHLGERLLTGGPAEAGKLGLGAAFTTVAYQHGNLNSLAPEQIKQVFDFLGALGGVQLKGLGGFTGRDLKNQLVANSLPGIATLGAGDQALEGQLKSAFDENLAKSAAAQEAFLAVQRDLATRQETLQLGVLNDRRRADKEFLAELGGMHGAFLANLHKNLVSVEVLQKETAKGRLAGELSRASQVGQQADFLQVLGIKDDAVLKRLQDKENQKTLRELADKQNTLNDAQDALGGGDRLDAIRGFHYTKAAFTGFRSGYTTPNGATVEDFLPLLQKAYGEKVTSEDATAVLKRYATGYQLLVRDNDENDPMVQRLAREGLVRATQDVMSERFGKKQADLTEKKGELAGKLGTSGKTLETILAELAAQRGDSSLINPENNRFDVFKAVEAVKSVTEVRKSIDDLSTQIAELNAAIKALKSEPVTRASGGPIPAGAGGAGMFRARGTDTVPAMLTPGEYVVNAASARHNMGLLEAINDQRGPLGLSAGGIAYLARGGPAGGLTPPAIQRQIAEALLPLEGRLPATVIGDIRNLGRTGVLSPEQARLLTQSILFRRPLPGAIEDLLKTRGIVLPGAGGGPRPAVPGAPGSSLIAVSDRGFEEGLKALPDDQLDAAFEQARVIAYRMLQEQAAATKYATKFADVRLARSQNVNTRGLLLAAKEQVLGNYGSEESWLRESGELESREDKIGWMAQLPTQAKVVLNSLVKQRGAAFAQLDGMSPEQLQNLYLTRVLPQVAAKLPYVYQAIKRLSVNSEKYGENDPRRIALLDLQEQAEFLEGFPTDAAAIKALKGAGGKAALLDLMKKAYNGRSLPKDLDQFLPDLGEIGERLVGIDKAKAINKGDRRAKMGHLEEVAAHKLAQADNADAELADFKKSLGDREPTPEEAKELARLEHQAETTRVAAAAAASNALPKLGPLTAKKRADIEAQLKARELETAALEARHEQAKRELAKAEQARDDAAVAGDLADWDLEDVTDERDRLRETGKVKGVFGFSVGDDPDFAAKLEAAEKQVVLATSSRDAATAEWASKNKAYEEASSREKDTAGKLTEVQKAAEDLTVRRRRIDESIGDLRDGARERIEKMRQNFMANPFLRPGAAPGVRRLPSDLPPTKRAARAADEAAAAPARREELIAKYREYQEFIAERNRRRGQALLAGEILGPPKPFTFSQYQTWQASGMDDDDIIEAIGLADGGRAKAYDDSGRLVRYRPRGTDTVPAMLTEGEFVVNRDSARANLGLLRTINETGGPVGGMDPDRYDGNGSVRHYASGGVVGGRGAAGGSVAFGPDMAAAMNGLAASLGTFGSGIQALQAAVNEWATRTDGLVTALQNLNNMHLTVEGRQTVEVIVNGAEVMTQLLPTIQEMIQQKTTQAVGSLLKRHLPDAGVTLD